jgi:predicted SAM-dependent methyltransferase
MIETIKYKGTKYPKYQADGFASRFIFPFAKEVCKGKGYDIGCNRKEWSFPGSIPIDPVIDPKYDCLNLPDQNVDYIFSSHMLEHINSWVKVLDYWYEKLNTGGVLFLYLPDYSQEYWRPWNNTKHVNIFSPEIIRNYLENKKMKNIFSSQRDLYNSFAVFGEK